MKKLLTITLMLAAFWAQAGSRKSGVVGRSTILSHCPVEGDPLLLCPAFVQPFPTTITILAHDRRGRTKVVDEITTDEEGDYGSIRPSPLPVRLLRPNEIDKSRGKWFAYSGVLARPPLVRNPAVRTSKSFKRSALRVSERNPNGF